jgi:hypothetical protein
MEFRPMCPLCNTRHFGVAHVWSAGQVARGEPSARPAIVAPKLGETDFRPSAVPPAPKPKVRPKPKVPQIPKLGTVNKGPTANRRSRVDYNTYQRDLMRKRRAAAKATSS